MVKERCRIRTGSRPFVRTVGRCGQRSPCDERRCGHRGYDISAPSDEQSVPDALAPGPDGVLYAREFTGGSQTRGSARIWRVVPGQAPTVFATGLTSVTALAVGPDGSVYATQFYPGNVVRIRPKALARCSRDTASVIPVASR
jgi:hypothetical protein